MPPCDEVGDGPAVLQLRKWSSSEFKLELSEFCEAFISPTRKLLLLLSYHSEALLLPLLAGEISSSNKERSVNHNIEELEKSSLLPVDSAEQTDIRLLDSSGNVECSSKPVDVVSDAAPASCCYPVISNVKSLAWGHWGDTYGDFKDHGFRELLFISDCNNIIVHAFRYRDVNSQVIESAPADGYVHGKWIEWQSTYCADGNEQFVSHADSLDEAGSTTGTKGRFNAGVEHVDDPSSISTPTKWFRTYLTEVSAIESGGSFLAKFPTKSSIPHSAEAVSFSIFESTLTFLESSSCYSQKENQGSGSVCGLVGSALSSGGTLGTPGMSSLDREADHAGTWKCSKLFSSPLHHLIGLVLTYLEDGFIKTSEEFLLNAERTLVVVVMPHEWGIQWVCSVNPNGFYPGPGPGPGWADFQYSENRLVCLNTAGLISIWDAKTGSFVTCLDVLESCGLRSKNDFEVGESFLASEKDSCCSEQEENDISKVKKSETCSTVSVPSRVFRRLLVSSNSLLLASIDEHGVIYVLNGDDYTSETHSALEEYKAPPRDSKLGMLEAWKIAGLEIGSRKVLSDLKNIKYFCGSGTAMGGFSSKNHKDSILRKRGKQSTEGKREQVNTSLNCVSMASWRKGAPVPYLETGKLTTAMRRIFVPLDRSNKKEFIFFSPFGITKLIRSCNSREEKYCTIVHTHLHVGSPFVQDQEFNTCLPSQRFSSLTMECTLAGESIGCLFQGCLYIVTADGLSVILPAISVSSGMLSIDTLRYWQPSTGSECKDQVSIFSYMNDCKGTWRPWQVEVLDRVLLYEGPEEAEELCSHNNWDLKVARLRRMQLALQYLKFDEIQKSLDMLAQVNLAEEGVLRLLFTSLYQISCKGSDSETALALRLLSLSARFATKMVRNYGLRKHKKDDSFSSTKKSLRISYLQTALQKHHSLEISNSRRLCEMAHFLEVIRNIQSRLIAKGRRPGHVLVLDGTESSNLVDGDELQDDSPLPIVEADCSSSLLDNLDAQTIPESNFHSSEFKVDDNIEDLALAPTEFSTHAVDLLGLDGSQRRKLIAVENSREMLTRWEIDHLDLRMVVKDALQSGRLPLAVLQLHLQRQKEFVSEDSHDTFNEVRKVGRAVAYDLFLKGDSGLAVATLQRLGEDIETSLRELFFGTVRRSLRARIVEEMKAHGYLRTDELHKLEKLSVIERLYPSSSFWVTFLGRKKETSDAASISNVPEANSLKVTLHLCDNLNFECGDIDGVISGLWASVDNDSSLSEICEDNGLAGCWACAFVWSNAWDDRTMERIVLDQPFHMGVHVPWETQVEYYMLHNDLEEVYKLLDVIPSSSLDETALEVNLDVSHSPGKVPSNVKYLPHDLYISSSQELEPVCLIIPNIKSFNFSATNWCSSWLKMHVERQLAKKYIFIQEYWGSTTEIVVLLARAGLLISPKVTAEGEYSEGYSTSELTKIGEQVNEKTAEAIHKLLIRYCAQYNLPSLLDLYLDHMDLIEEENTLSSLLEAAGDCQWAKWLLFSRIKGHEYEASFSNARSNLTHHTNNGSKLSNCDVDDIIHTVDDVAEGGGEMAALATLMYATAPLQKCLCPGSVKQHCNLSSQCTLENIRPGLQQFPTLWRTLVMSCFGQDINGCSLSSAASNVYGRSALSEYLTWRNTIFSSAGGDTSLTQMLPCWFPKSIRRLLRLFVQGPLGWHALSGEIPGGEHFLDRDSRYALSANGNATVSAVSWESSIQKCIEEELYSSVEENAFGVEHHLHRGCALAAFDHLLGIRAQKLKSTQELSGQTNVQSDVQMILAPLTQSEESFLSSVVPLALTHFDDSVLVASCAFLLELCGLSASMLRVDIAALHRISSYYSSVGCNSLNEFSSPKVYPIHAIANEVDLAMSLARALADEYLHMYQHKALKQKDAMDNVSMRKQPSHALMTVLHHLERASLPVIEQGRTCGSWLSSGIGDGAEFRSHQREASQHWKLVSTFCHMHNLPLSTNYLVLLAYDNDWVGFLTEAQTEGFSVDTVLQVAAKEFSDPRLKTHVLTVLKSMQSSKKKTNLSTDASASERGCAMPFLSECKATSPVELFGIISECEKQKNPGESLLIKAKDLRWPLLAVIASCFSDVPPLSCLTVWLEITAARETSSIQVNDVYTKITTSVGAAVEAINALPSGSRTFQYRYNRRNPKRRRLLEPESWNLTTEPSCMSPRTSSPSIVPIVQEIANEDEWKRTVTEQMKMPNDVDEGLASLANMVAVLCEQHLFLPLLRAFEMFLPSCSLLPYVRSLQAFSQMRLSDAAAHLASFSVRIKEESFVGQLNNIRDTQIKTSWISSTAVKAADAILSTCPSAYERRCLLQLLAAADFGDGGITSTHFRRLYWKINLAEPSLRKDDEVYLGNEILDDASLLIALEKNGQWEKARNWARQLESSGSSWKSAVHHVTETQAEAMVTEWKEFLWDVPEERSAVWNHCHALFLRYSFPPLQAGLFFLKHAGAIEKEIPARELHEILLLSLQWLSGTVSQCNPVYPLYLLREIETRVWLLAVESEAQSKVDGDFTSSNSTQNLITGNSANIIDHTANIIAKMDNHINSMHWRTSEKNGIKDNTHNRNFQVSDSHNPSSMASNTRIKRRAKTYLPLRKPVIDLVYTNNDTDDYMSSSHGLKPIDELPKNMQSQEENVKIEASVSGWEEKVRPAELERAVLSLLEFGQITAAKQLQQKLSPAHVPAELVLVDAALKLAALSSSSSNGEISDLELDEEVLSVIRPHNAPGREQMVDPLQAMEYIAAKCGHGCGRGICRRIIAVVKAAKVLGISFSEAFEKRPIELLQLLSLKAQDSLEEAKLLVQTHTMPSSSIARILAESFLKGLLAAHRGGYMDSQKEEGPAPLLWRFSDFLKWAEHCPSEQEIGHALMRLVMTGQQEIPHACEVELLILSDHFYKSSSCLDGVDVLVALAANRVESYVLEGDFSCLARLITGVSNFHALNFILDILIENGQLELLLQKSSTAETASSSAEAVRGFRMAVLTSLKLFNPHDLDAFAMVYNHFDMKHETASLLESRSQQCIRQWFMRRYKDQQTEDLLESMHYLIEAAEVYSTIDAGNKTHRACARASLLSLQIRIPDVQWLDLSETNARRALVEQSRFQEALIVAEAYSLNQPGEWALVLWNQMLKPDLVEQFVAEFVAVLPLQPSMLLELARFYRAEVAARGDQSHFSVWLSPGGLPAEWVKHLGRSFRSLLKRTRDLRVRVQLATIATGFTDVVNSCTKVLDKVPDNAGPLILRKGHGGAYVPLM